MLWLDAFLRIGAIMLLSMSAILSVRDRLTWRPAIYIVLVAISVSAMLIASAPEALMPPLAVLWPALIVESASVVFIWWFGLALFRDGFELKWPHWVILAVTVGLRLPQNITQLSDVISYPPILAILCEVVVLGMMVHLAVAIIREGRDDLVTTRRDSRAYFIGALLASVIISSMTSQGAAQGWFPISIEEARIIKSFSVFPLALWFNLWLSQLNLENLSFETEAEIEAVETPIDPRDTQLLTELRSAMEVEKIYREAGLTIRELAEHLNTPEHRLRSLINQGLGYRNFSAFLNSYRIEAVKDQLSDPDKLRIPILTLAMDVGYNSLAPFNRAFRAIEGMTPTAYRQQRLQNETAAP
ncbi:AraC family transcriptional regulator [Litorimonas taeanensis]|uniref:AraC family transcriptional regulator n=1 Tax=Litorimonas taeanensis TaxID=568099 RepID=A0A420WED0_9PROT|nr:helix-turn-helix domain-containing protein [Litorimonas taeanensis]RKQ69338.1 AraC family transcriptional regulator [Litorimonas taeanensis]